MASRNRNIKRASQKNPRNPDSTLFKKLTRLFSGPIVNYRHQQVRRHRKHNLDKFGKTFKSATGQQFKKKSYNPFEPMLASMMANQSRAERYSDFDQMEYTPELASALDIYADEITTHSSYGDLLRIECPNEEIKAILRTLFYQVLNVEFNLFGWARSMAKFGDFFLYLDIDEQIGIKSAIGLPPNELERMEGEDTTNPNYVQYQWNAAGMTLENWQVAHFRILGNDKHSPYGTSVLDPARRIWRQLTMLEDAMMAYRIVRAPDRRVFYIDVGGIPPEDVEQFMQRAMTQMKRHQVVDANTGHVDLRYNPASIEEDYYIPVRGGVGGTKIETLAGTSWGDGIEDVKYLRDKMFSAIKIPASYLSRGDGADEDKTTLAQKDIRFARTIQRLQRSIVSELEKVAIVHLYTLGYSSEDLVSFKLRLHNPSKIAQLQELEHWRTKLELAANAGENMFSKRWIATNILDVSEEEFVRNQRERFHDKKYEAAMNSVAEATGEAAGAAEAMALGGDEMAMDEEEMDLGAPAEDLPTPEPPVEPPEEPPEDEGVLLATPEAAGPPGKRDEPSTHDWVKVAKKDMFGKKQTTTSKSHGWYEPVDTDKRKGMGPRKKNMMAQGGHKQGGRRGTVPGFTGLSSLSMGIVSENKSNYNADVENNIFETTQEVKQLIESLEKKNGETKTQ